MAALRTALRRSALREATTATRIVAAAPRMARIALPAANSTPSFAIRSFTSTPSNLKAKRNEWASNPVIGYEEIKALARQPTDKTLLVDVRDEDETCNGTIPSAVVLPLPRLKEALSEGFNPGSFQKEFGFSKPTYDQNLVFYCLTDVRSQEACEQANAAGYPNTRYYQGGWENWVEHKQGKE